MTAETQSSEMEWFPPAERGVIHDHITREVRPDDAEAFSLMKQGGTYRMLPDRLRRYRIDIFDDKYKRLSWKEQNS